jgi:hypothetical protein
MSQVLQGVIPGRHRGARRTRTRPSAFGRWSRPGMTTHMIQTSKSRTSPWLTPRLTAGASDYRGDKLASPHPSSSSRFDARARRAKRRGPRLAGHQPRRLQTAASGCPLASRAVAVGGRVHDSLGGNAATGAWSVLDDELLAETLRQPLTDEACDDVGRATRSKADNQAHRLGRIGLRLRSARDDWKRGGARCQM